MRIFVLISLIFVFSFTACSQKNNVPVNDSMTAVLGDWYGESKCVGSNTYCHDEVVIYHLTRSDTDNAKVHFVADKVVNGKPEFMGEFEMTFDDKKLTLTAEFTIPRTGGKGVWLFQVVGDKMDGTLTVFPENEVGRKIHVERKKEDK